MQQTGAGRTQNSLARARGDPPLARGRKFRAPHRRGSPLAPATAARIPRRTSRRRQTPPRIRGLGARALERRLIVGTAGHIDHGKTALVKALTGVDADRLPEEKRRGITIDLGFAPLSLDGLGTVGVIDVPGHEDFIRSMLVGASGIDLGLLVVAADEGVMPQTREHLLILGLLGIPQVVVALTKTDLVDDEWLGLVRDDVLALFDESQFPGPPVVSCSSRTLAGLDELRAVLSERLAKAAPRGSEDLFRMPVDRAFTIKGTGTVVTGTVWSGELSVDAGGCAGSNSTGSRPARPGPAGAPPSLSPGWMSAMYRAAPSSSATVTGVRHLCSRQWSPSSRIAAPL